MTRQFPVHISDDYKPRPTHPHERTYAGLARSDPRGTSLPHHQPRANSHTTTGQGAGSGAAATARRRIPVACGRCRKRKIRCSGDPGDKSGCTNCRNAGQVQTCAFLRVQCEEIAVNEQMLMEKLPKQLSSASIEFPYCTSTASVSAPSLISSFDPFSAHHQLRSSHSAITLGQNYHFGNNLMAVKPYYQPGATENATSLLLGNANAVGLSRSQLLDSLATDLNGSSDVSGPHNGTNGLETYDGAVPPYILPDIGQGLGSTNILQPDLLRQWTPLTSGTPRSQPSLYMDHDQPGQLSTGSQALQSYTLSGHSHTRLSAQTVDTYGNSAAIFPALSNLSDTLPTPSVSGTNGYSSRQLDKLTLPTLFPSRNQGIDMNVSHSRSTSLAEASPTAAYSGGSNQSSSSYKSYGSWSDMSLTPTPALSYSTTSTPASTASASSYLTASTMTSMPQSSESLLVQRTTTQASTDTIPMTSSYLSLPPHPQTLPLMRSSSGGDMTTERNLGPRNTNDLIAKVRPTTRQSVTLSAYSSSPTVPTSRSESSASARSTDSQSREFDTYTSQHRRVSKVY